MSTNKKTEADNERRLWRVAADYQFGQHDQEPRDPVRFKRIMTLMAEEFEAKSDDEVLQHVAYRKRAAKKGATVSYFEVSGRKTNGIFCPNELNSISQEMTATLANHNKGGQPSGYTLPFHLSQREMTEFYVLHIAKYGEKTRAAQRVVAHFGWGRDENGDIPTEDVLNSRVRLFDRWREKFGI